MKKKLYTLIIILGIALIISGIILWIYPQWVSLRGWWLILLGAVFVAVAQLGESLKGWRDFLFEEKTDLPVSDSQRTPSIEVKGNWLVGNNKIKIRKKDTHVLDNSMLGKNKIEIGDPKSEKNKGK